MEEATYYAIIPSRVRYDKELSANEKLLYGEITALASKSGLCWATNKYFSELYEKEPRTIRRWIEHLVELGYVYRAVEYDEDEKTVIRRCLSIVPEQDMRQMSWADKNVRTLGTEMSAPSGQKCPPPSLINNTSINNNSLSARTREEKREDMKAFFAAYPDIVANNCSFGSLAEMDFYLIKQRFDESEFLRDTFKTLSKICRNYVAIQAGDYKDGRHKGVGGDYPNKEEDVTLIAEKGNFSEKAVTRTKMQEYFDKIYEIYPRQVNKVEGRETFMSKLKGLPEKEARERAGQIYKALKLQITLWSEENDGRGREFDRYPYFANWLNRNVDAELSVERGKG